MALTAGVLLVDQATKYWALAELTRAFDQRSTFTQRLGVMFSEAPARFGGLHHQQKRSIEISERFLRLRYAENEGAAFGLFRTLPPALRGPFFHLVSLGAVVLISLYYRRLSADPKEKWARWGLPLILGGALGNYVDRLARSFVIDFIEAHWLDQHHWPSFNIADAAISIGVGMLVVDAMVRREEKPVRSKAT